MKKLKQLKRLQIVVIGQYKNALPESNSESQSENMSAQTSSSFSRLIIFFTIGIVLLKLTNKPWFIRNSLVLF